MRQRASLSTTATDPERLANIRTLLNRYPGTTPLENDEIILFLRKGPIMDRALLSGYEDVRHNLTRFTADHRRAFSFSTFDWLVAASVLVATILIGYFLWDAGV